MQITFIFLFSFFYFFKICIDAVKELKENFPDIDIVAGSIATGEGAEKLVIKIIIFFLT